MSNTPRGFDSLLLDIMVAVLSDVGFAGNNDSTMSKHVDRIRTEWSRDQLCAAHDATAAEEAGGLETDPMACPAKPSTRFDRSDHDF
jgi:hypothetical protein